MSCKVLRLSAPEPWGRRVPEVAWRTAEALLAELTMKRRAASELLASTEERVVRAERDAAERAGAEVRAELGGLLAELAAARERLWAEAEPQLVALATAIAGSVLEEAVRRDPALIVGLVRRALETCRSGTPLAVRVHPAALAAVERAREALDSRAGPLELAGDPELEPGGAVVRAALGEIDASLSVQLAGVCRALREWAEQGRAERRP